MKKILTSHVIENKSKEHIKWLLENDNAKEIINYFLLNNERHFLVQNLEPNFTFTSEYVFDNLEQRPAIYFTPNLKDRLLYFVSFKKAKEDLKNYFSVKFDIFLENKKRQMKIVFDTQRLIKLFYKFLKTANQSNFLSAKAVMFFDENISQEIYYVIEGGLERKYYLACISDKLFFADKENLFINTFALLKDKKEKSIEIKMKNLGNLSKFLEEIKEVR